MCLYPSLVLESTRDMRDSRSLVNLISIGAMAIPGPEDTLKELIRDVASMNSFSCVTFSEGRGTPKLNYTSVKT